MRRPGFKLRGQVTSHAVVGSSGHRTVRHFCAVCGSSLFGLPEVEPDIVTIYAGALDDPSVFRPQLVIYTRSRPAWDAIAGNLPEFETEPPA